MRNALSNALVELSLVDPKVLVLTGDHGYALFDEFRKRCPDQYVNAGIAEQNMIGMAAGLARVGYRPIVYGLAAFVPIRTIEQIKIDIAHDNLPVILLGDGAGFVYSHLGTSHQSTEDIACVRAIPGIEVLSPADRFEMAACMHHAYSRKGPAYIRIGKSDRGDVHPDSIGKLQPGRLIRIFEGKSAHPGLIATGSMVRTALDIAMERDLSVWSAPSIKPISIDDVCAAALCSNGLVTLEEHSVLGGLGAAITEIICDHVPTRVLRIGVEDRFSEKCGSYDYLLNEHKIDIISIGQRIDDFIESV